MDPITVRHWTPRFEISDVQELNSYAHDLGLSKLVAKILLGRQLSRKEAEGFLSAGLSNLPSPFLLPDVEKAVERLETAIRLKETIAVHGDYDVDGVSGTALLISILQELGGQVEFFIPSRLRDGYGLSAEALRSAANRNVKVLVTVDCGISAFDEAHLASQLGMDLIITDHHQPHSELPEALAIVNPMRSDSTFPFKELAGVGVAFFVMIALRKTLRDSGWFSNRKEPDLRQFLDLVALGTIADLVPLQGVNRIMCRQGLELMQIAPREGLFALKDVASIKNISSGTIGFQIAPRLNAAGRMQDASIAVELLLERDKSKAQRMARKLDQWNLERRNLENETFEQALTDIQEISGFFTHSIVLAREGWHSGVIGIVASRIVELFHRPTVLIALDGQTGRGSARSIHGFHLSEAFQACNQNLLTYGGHAMAAGLTLEKHQLKMFSHAFESYARKAINQNDLIPKIHYDGLLSMEDIDLSSLEQLMELSPFGMKNPEPKMLLESVHIEDVQKLQGGHLRFTVIQDQLNIQGIAFGMMDREVEFSGEVDLLVSPQINFFGGKKNIQLRVVDVRSSKLPMDPGPLESPVI